MKTLPAKFDLLNNGKTDLIIYMEPDGGYFLLPPGKKLDVRMDAGSFMNMWHDMKDGKMAVVIWLNDDGIEVLYEGRDVVELIRKL